MERGREHLERIQKKKGRRRQGKNESSFGEKQDAREQQPPAYRGNLGPNGGVATREKRMPTRTAQRIQPKDAAAYGKSREASLQADKALQGQRNATGETRYTQTEVHRRRWGQKLAGGLKTRQAQGERPPFRTTGGTLVSERGNVGRAVWRKTEIHPIGGEKGARLALGKKAPRCRNSIRNKVVVSGLVLKSPSRENKISNLSHNS